MKLRGPEVEGAGAAQFLVPLPRDSLAGCFSASYDYATGDVPYPIDVDVTTHLGWWIRIVD